VPVRHLPPGSALECGSASYRLSQPGLPSVVFVVPRLRVHHQGGHGSCVGWSPRRLVGKGGSCAPALQGSPAASSPSEYRQFLVNLVAASACNATFKVVARSEACHPDPAGAGEGSRLGFFSRTQRQPAEEITMPQRAYENREEGIHPEGCASAGRREQPAHRLRAGSLHLTELAYCSPSPIRSPIE